VFVLFVCLALLVVNGWLAMRSRDEALRQATISDTNLTRAIAQQMDSMFSETSRIMDNVAFELERSNNKAKTFQLLQPVMVNYAAATEQINGLFVLDEVGARIISSEAAVDPSINGANHDYFIYHRDNLSLMRHVGKPILSQLSKAWLIPVSRRINDLDGHFAGVVLATIDVDYVRGLMSEYEVGQTGAISLNLNEGPVLARRPFATGDLVKSAAGSAQLNDVRNNQAGTIRMISPLDGVERMVSYQHLKNHSLFVTVALGSQEVLHHWRTTTYVQTGWILVLCLFIGLSGSAVITSVRGRLKVEQRLRATRDELTEANTQLTQLARYDGLTDLANRRYFDEHLDREFTQALRTRRPLALVMIDVDHFKLYNDTYGHPQGDKCLQAVAGAIKSAVRRPQDFVARYGGEEFVVLLSETDAAGAAVVAEAIRAAVELLHVSFVESAAGYLSVSAGVAAHSHPRPRSSALELLNASDRSLYQAKRDGRNCVFADV
jgi:diguanylate cyclase (GGDEF)-like protein